MRTLKFVILFLLTAGLTYSLNHSISTSTRSIPPIGKLLNPFTGFWQNGEATQSNFNHTYQFPELNGKVNVKYDDRMVPHIFAEYITDALFVQGYITASMRLWQMDIVYRSMSGRISEVSGPRAIPHDRLQRRKGIVFAAENALRTWEKSPIDLQNLSAYTAGVNAYIKDLSPRDYPIEFKLMDYAPEPWTNLKSAVFLESMALSLCSRENDIESTNALNFWGEDDFNFLYPEYNPDQSPIIPDSTLWNFDTVKIEKTSPILIGQIDHSPYTKAEEGLGSNNWAVSGQKTASGNPILCNDPHLQMTLPAIWFEIQLHTPQMNAYGVSLPGFPGIVIGFNEHISWGMTNVSHDVLDWYQIKWADDQKKSYLVDGETRPARLKIETIKVKGKADVLDTVRYTHWGPVTYEDPKHPKQDMAMRWLAHDEGANELNVFMKLNSAKNYTDYIQAIATFNAPPQNIIFAAKDGDIAIKVQGQLPLREPQQGRFVLDGSVSSNAWHGFIPNEHNPVVKNPERGYVSSANQHSTSPDYPYYYSGNFDDYRGRMLNTFLDTMENISIEDMMRLQNSNYSIKAQETLPLFISLLDPSSLSAEHRSLLEELQKWDYQYNEDQQIPILFDEWYEKVYFLTWDEVRIAEESLQASLLYPEDWRTIQLIKEMPDHKFFDIVETKEKESAAQVIQQAFETVASEWEKTGKNSNWPAYKATAVRHLAGIPSFGFNNLPIGGHKTALNAIKKTSGPSWRMIVELGDEIKAYGVYPGGQSGNPGSPYYSQMLDHWAKGKYYELLFLKDQNATSSKIIGTAEFSNR